MEVVRELDFLANAVVVGELEAVDDATERPNDEVLLLRTDAQACDTDAVVRARWRNHLDQVVLGRRGGRSRATAATVTSCDSRCIEEDAPSVCTGIHAVIDSQPPARRVSSGDCSDGVTGQELANDTRTHPQARKLSDACTLVKRSLRVGGASGSALQCSNGRARGATDETDDDDEFASDAVSLGRIADEAGGRVVDIVSATLS